MKEELELEGVREELKELQLNFKRNIKTIGELQKENKKIGELLEKIDSKLTGKKKRKGYLFDIEDDLKGFILSQRKTGGKHSYWYAGKRIKNKLVWVYIGKEKEEAAEKIENWLEKQESKALSKKKMVADKKEPVKRKEVVKDKAVVRKGVEKVSKEEIEQFHREQKAFYESAKQIGKAFPEKGKEVLSELEELAKEFVSKQSKLETRVAAELNHIQEIGGLQSKGTGNLWRFHNLPIYKVSTQISNLLSKFELSKESLLSLFALLIIGLPGSKSSKSLENALVNELSIRANTR